MHNETKILIIIQIKPQKGFSAIKSNMHAYGGLKNETQ